jgi:hypothetical protein
MKNFYIKFFFLLASLIITINSQITLNFEIDDNIPLEQSLPSNSNLRSSLEIDTQNEMEFKTVLKACLGTPPQCFHLGVQTNTFYIWVRSSNSREKESKLNTFDITKSTTIQKNNQYFQRRIFGRKVTGFEARDILTIKGKEYSRINFLVLETTDTLRDIEGFIGLGYTPNANERKFSIIQQLFENGVIPHKVFTQKYFTLNKGQLTIGEIPKYILKDYTHYGRCAALDKIIKGKKYKNNNWECKIDSIFYDNKEKNIIPMKSGEQKMSFLSYRKRSFVPLEVFDQIGNGYLNDEIKKGECWVKHEQRYSFYECKSDTEIKNITFVFGDWEFTVESKNMFRLKGNSGTKELNLYHKDNFEEFLLGRSLLKGFEMVYDYANKQIGFYHKTVNYKGKLKVTPPKIYQFLEEEDEFQPKTIKDRSTVLPKTNPEEVKIKGNQEVEESKIYMITDVIKNVLSILIIIAVIIIIVAIYIYSKKYVKKEKIKKAKKYLQEEMISQENNTTQIK